MQNEDKIILLPPFLKMTPKLRGLVTVSLDPVGMWWYRPDCSVRAGARLGMPPLLSTRQLSADRSPANIYTAPTLERKVVFIVKASLLPVSADVKEQLLTQQELTIDQKIGTKEHLIKI